MRPNGNHGPLTLAASGRWSYTAQSLFVVVGHLQDTTVFRQFHGFFQRPLSYELGQIRTVTWDNSILARPPDLLLRSDPVTQGYHMSVSRDPHPSCNNLPASIWGTSASY